MTTSNTARFLNDAIRNSDLTQGEIAAQAGFSKPNVLSMMKTGVTKVPLARIPALASALDVDAAAFLATAIEEYHPELHDVLWNQLGFPLDPEEQKLLTIYHIASIKGDIRIDGAVEAALRAVMDLAATASD